ncbi:hypothetical protein H8R20_18120 [Morganella morganii]|uniref:hypothetical protein n=1 Tax=Morganella morganii TaxID=582 RepID=UPI0016463DB1|nr:hypothetical protein [Morganella morganii]MBC3997504.1 hypothetical protein [Morganella morganii]
MSENEIKETPLTGLDAVKALEALQDNPELRAYFMNGLLEKGYDLEKLLESIIANLPDTVNTAVISQIQKSAEELSKNLTAINDSIGDLPQNLDQQVALFRDVLTETREQVNQEVNTLQTKVETINAMALNTIAKAMGDNVQVFEKELRQAKNKVFAEGIEVVKDTNRQTAWLIIGAVLVINVCGIAASFFLR